MRQRDLAAGAGLGLTLLGVTGEFGIWWALILGGLLIVALTVALTLIDLRPKPKRRVKPDA